MKKIQLYLLLGIVVFATGCPPRTKPDVPAVMSERIVQYATKTFDADLAAYNQAMDSTPSQVELGTRIRDRVINRLKGNIDANYQDFENQLFAGRARSNILFDITEFGANVATTITNGERAKVIISAALTGFKGGRKSVDENFFRERTTAAIISQMQASRSHLETELLKNMRQNKADTFPLDAALGDLINYFYAGTLQKGLQELAQQTGQNAITAKLEAQGEREKLRAGTRENAVIAISIRDRFNQLFAAALTPPIDLDKQTEAIKVAKKALQDLSGKPPDPNISPRELFTALDAEMERVSTQGEAGVKRVRKAFGLPE